MYTHRPPWHGAHSCDMQVSHRRIESSSSDTAHMLRRLSLVVFPESSAADPGQGQCEVSSCAASSACWMILLLSLVIFPEQVGETGTTGTGVMSTERGESPPSDVVWLYSWSHEPP